MTLKKVQRRRVLFSGTPKSLAFRDFHPLEVPLPSRSHYPVPRIQDPGNKQNLSSETENST